MLLFGFVRPVVSRRLCGAVTEFMLVARIPLWLRQHGTLYTSTHVPIENTLLPHKMAKNSRMELCCQNRVSKGTIMASQSC